VSDAVIRRMTAAAVLIVALIAAVVSYVHIGHLAVTHGQTTLAAGLLPLPIDGTVAATSLAMLRAARAGAATPWLARSGLVLSVGATLAANVGYGLPYEAAGALIALEHKTRYNGSRIVRVPPAYTSQACHACGHCAPGNRESQAVFRCRACGHQANADVNAAKNILAAGLAVTGRGDLAAGRSVKRQPPKAEAA